MSDQMQDEVWLCLDAWGEIFLCMERPEPGESEDTRYIRADLYEKVKAERDDARARVEHLLTEICGGAANRHALAERCRAVEVKRDRLRAALERLMRGEGGVNSIEQERIAQEALDHD